MSDVAITPAAPAPAAAPPPQPSATEVPINPNPVSTPAPVGNQAPDKPVGADFKGSPHRPESRRETLLNAFKKAEAARADIKPREAKMGDNNPPEPMEREKEKPKEPPFNLKKRPDDQEKPEAPERQSDDRPRGEHGHFAPRQPQQPAAQPAAQQPQGQQPAWTRPIERMTDKAKADWAKTPDSVRQDVHRMHTELGRAYQQFRADHDEMNTIREFSQMAREHGTTLKHALSQYVGMEHKLRTDVVAGLDQIINNLNLTTPEGRKLNLQDVAWHIVNQTPEQRALLQSKNAMMAQSHQLAAANERIARLENQTKWMHYGNQFAKTRIGVDQFAKTHPRLDELGDLIEQEIKLGFDLDTAYQRAALLRPATAPQTRNGTTAAQTRTPTTAQTRTADRSISGAPDGPPSSARSHRKVSTREAVKNAMNRVDGF